MGYRKLLKQYMAHVREVYGSDAIELAAMTNALTKRELGELRTLTAEINREAFEHAQVPNRNAIVRKLLTEGIIELDQLDLVNGIDVGPDSSQISDEAFERVLITLIRSEQQRIAQLNDAAKNHQATE